MPESSGVQLRDGQSASNLFHTILWQTTQKISDLENHVNLTGDVQQFKRHYVELLPQFEAVRLSATGPASIASELFQTFLNELVFHDADGTRPLSVHLATTTEPAKLKTVSGTASDPWQFRLDYQGQSWQTLKALSDHLVSLRVINSAAGEALAWIQDQALEQGQLDLSDRKVVVIGAGAEMASTRLFLEAGADVLWLDMVAPSPDLLSGEFAGSLTWSDEPLDLLLEPAKVLATILEYGEGNPLDVCLYAYAPGQARELRLAGSMSALVEAIPDPLIKSITMLVSPTTTSRLSAEEVRDIEVRKNTAPLWEKSLGTLGLMGKPGVASYRNASVTRTLVNIQGASYQAAQYLGKLMPAEAWYARGLRVSANTAAITQTRSLDHPVFDAAFGGARALQVETFTPLQSQTINGLLTVHDWLIAERSVPGRIRVHGGIHSLPYPLDKALRIAAAIGFARAPRLLKGLLS